MDIARRVLARFLTAEANAQAAQSIKHSKKALKDLEVCARQLREMRTPAAGDPPGWDKFKLYHAERSLSKVSKAVKAALAYAKASLDKKAIDAAEVAVNRYKEMVEQFNQASDSSEASHATRH